MKLENKKILITGGGGFIGSSITDKLIEKNVKNIIIIDNWTRGNKDNLKNALKTGKVELIDGDIRDNNLLDKLMKGIDLIYHEAALKHNHCTHDPRLGHEVLVDGTFNVFEAAAKNKVKKIVFASSASVYGDPLSLPIKEEDPFNDKTLYGAGKIYNERIAIAFKNLYELNYVGLRYFNVYGPRMDIHGAYTEVLIRWLENIKNNNAPIIHGDGKQTMDFVYIDDVVDANILAAEKNVKEGFFNIATGIETSLLELLELLLEITNSNLKPKFIPDKPHSLANRRQADIQKAKNQLDFQAKVKLRAGLQKFVRWYNRNNK